METNFDIIIVGAGGSGLAAAVSAAEHGLTVLVLEKCPTSGGTTGLAVGSFTACETSCQQAKGIGDSLEAHVQDAGKFAPAQLEQRNHGPLRRLLLSEAANSLEWLQQMGIIFHGPHPEPPNRVPRMHNVVPSAKAYISVLHARLQKTGGTLLCNATVSRLIKDGHRVAGVYAMLSDVEHKFTARRGVVLAAGDYANSPKLIAEFKGPDYATIEGINRDATGDGHRLAREVGAQLVNMDVTYGPEIRFVPPQQHPWLQRLPARGWFATGINLLARRLPAYVERQLAKRLLVTWQHPEDSLLSDGAILLNREGRRFCDEQQSPEREIAISFQTDKQCYFLLDGQLTQKYSQWPHFISTAPEIAYAYVQDYQRLRPDITFRGETLAQVSQSCGLPEAQVAETVKQRRQSSHSLQQGPWVILGPAKAYFTTTEGGAAIDHDFRVLDESGNVIPGLYAVGQNGLGGQILWGHGLHIAWAITSGRLVGKRIAGQCTAIRKPGAKTH